MGVLHRAFKAGTSQFPTMALSRIIAPKLKAAGIRDYRKRADALAEHILTDGDETFSWGEGDSGEEIIITFDDNDTKEIDRLIARFKEALPDVVTKLARATAERVVDRSIVRWRESRYRDLREIEGFRSRLEDRWGDGLDLLRLLLDIAREAGQEYHEKLARSRSRKKLHLRVALSRLHIRACQVAYEIVALLENGLPDGAMARWRTLHEISMVALVIADAGDGVAERYLDHQIVETKKALETYILNYKELGFAAPSKSEIRRTKKAFDEAVARHGPEFRNQYGWAALYLKLKVPRFSDIQKAAGKAIMQSHYKMASYNVHATPKALTFRHGSLDERDMLIAGATNAGLLEPGQNLAFTLVQITSVLFDSSYTLDTIVSMETLVRLRDRAVKALVSADRQLRRDDAAVKEALSSQGLDLDIVW